MVRPSPVFLAIVGVAVLGGVLCSLADDNALFTMLTTGSHPILATAGVVLLVLGGWGVSLCLHEFGHAYLALRGGDYSVRGKGYLDLDPRRYTDPVLSLVLPLVFLILGGIPLPGGAVWINHHALRSKRAESLVSLAGPASNLILGLVLAAVVRLVPMPPVLVIGLAFLALLQIVAFLINIMPVPGLDGWGVIEPYLSYQAREFGAKARPWAPLVVFLLLIGVSGLSSLLFEGANAIAGSVASGTLDISPYLRPLSFGDLTSLGFEMFLFWR